MEESERRQRRHRKRSPRGSPREADRSQSRKRRRSSGKRSKSPLPREKRSRSPRHAGVRIKQELEDHSRRGHEERQNQDRSELEHKQQKGNRERCRDHSVRRKLTKEQGESRGRKQDAHHLLDQQAEREFYNERRRQHRQQMEASGDEENSEGKGPSNKNADKEASKKEKPSFELSGALLEDSNTFRGVVIKYTEPPEARIPKKRWRLYPFKNDEVLPVMYIHRQSAYLLGRHRRIADIPIDHPSCSKQHAVFQYRLVEYTRPDGTAGRKVKPYIIDLGSGNGTFLNNQRIEPQRYYELREKDVLKFGFSSREYVLLHESSDATEDDQKTEEEEEEESTCRADSE
ncbi:smad nuclear-interacting protein 1 [Ahaetulla prasina]|uniref:smad nuclear-interacting protein 1 n=1 Tax=Ahaetulla prasina TaxID=499056 RepID=UPI00264A046B|nr:smad nuclear-interacting protein 1 [Ahaetulla prasina]